MPFYFRKIIFFIIAVLLISVSFYVFVSADTTQQTINVKMKVPGGGPGDGGDKAPTISNVTSSTSYTTATINWSANDDKGITLVTFVYGLTTGYGNSKTPAGSYSVSLSGLATSTVYYFKISVTDTINQKTEFTGLFRTVSEPLPPDTTPPNITNVQVAVGTTTSSIGWQTDESATSQVNYGLTTSYGSSLSDINRVLLHSILLFDLLPNITYHFKISSTDAAGNSNSTSDSSFTSLKDNVPPPNVSDLNIATTTASVVLSWTNPSLLITADWSGLKIVRKIGSAPADVSDGAAMYTGTGATFIDSSVLRDTAYFYTLFSFDTSGNYSSGISGSAMIPSPMTPIEICNNSKDDDGDGKIDCADSDCQNFSACQSLQEICDNGIDDDLDNKIDCADSDCQNFSACKQNQEICDNGIDDNGDGKIDCIDSQCAAAPFCQVPLVEICDNGIDDDSDGKADCADSDCSGFSACISKPPEEKYEGAGAGAGSGMSLMGQIKTSDLFFLGANRQIILSPRENRITNLAGMGLTIGVPRKVLLMAPESIILKVGESDQYQFSYDAHKEIYYTDISIGGGAKQARLEVNYGNGLYDSLSFELIGLPWGDVKAGDERLSGAEVILFQKNGVRMPMENYGQSNPRLTNVNGIYGWVVPNGDYYVKAIKNGYYDREIPVFTVENNVVNGNLSLIAKPPEIKINPEAPLEENIINVAEALGLQAKAAVQQTVQSLSDTAKVITRAAAKPEVKQAARKVVAPTAVGVVAIGTLPFISWVNLLPLLRLMFLQPIIIVGRRKREKWGQAYNALDKLPLDLAIIRLLDAETGKVLQTQVTDKQGRYAFIADTGAYKLEAQKGNFVFPSALLAGYKNDGRRTDIYHGEVISVTEKDSLITANIPMDLAGEHKKPARLIWDKFGRGAQRIIGGLGFIATLVSLYIAHTWYVAALLGVHIVLFFFFRRLSKPVKIKGWGIVYDIGTKEPIKQVIARLFNAEFNKLISTQITDKRGRYYFLAGDDKYYVTFNHKDYHPKQTDIIDLLGKEAETIANDVPLVKKELTIDEIQQPPTIEQQPPDTTGQPSVLTADQLSVAINQVPEESSQLSENVDKLSTNENK